MSIFKQIIDTEGSREKLLDQYFNTIGKAWEALGSNFTWEIDDDQELLLSIDDDLLFRIDWDLTVSFPLSFSYRPKNESVLRSSCSHVCQAFQFIEKVREL